MWRGGGFVPQGNRSEYQKGMGLEYKKRMELEYQNGVGVPAGTGVGVPAGTWVRVLRRSRASNVFVFLCGEMGYGFSKVIK